jgi:hypothetical protein
MSVGWSGQFQEAPPFPAVDCLVCACWLASGEIFVLMLIWAAEKLRGHDARVANA